MSNKITLLLEENLIKRAKMKALENNTSISEVCRGLLSAWQTGLFGYEKYSEKRRLPAIPAVYFVYDDDKIIYVGQSQNVKNRLLTHDKHQEFNKPSVTVFWIMATPELKTKIEQFCINTLNPELNKIHDGGMGKIYSDYEYIPISFAPPSDGCEAEALDKLIYLRPGERATLLEKWYQAWKGQNVRTD